METKSLIEALASRIDRNTEELEKITTALEELLVETLKEGDTVALPGFGQFEPKLREERVTTHPATGKKILVPPRITMVFRPSAMLKQKVK